MSVYVLPALLMGRYWSWDQSLDLILGLPSPMKTSIRPPWRVPRAYSFPKKAMDTWWSNPFQRHDQCRKHTLSSPPDCCFHPSWKDSLSLGIYGLFWHSAGAILGRLFSYSYALTFSIVMTMDCYVLMITLLFMALRISKRRLRARYKYIVCFYVIVL